MYQEFYNLKEKPFSLTPDPQFLYLSESHRIAMESLLYGIEQKEGFIVITGDIGTGKTTICRALLNKLGPQVKTAVIFNSFLSEEELLESILIEFGFPSKGRTKKERIDALNKLLIHLLSQGKNAVLIIDEAQNLSVPVLEQIRMLSNLETEKEKLLQIILFGQLELDQKLQSPELRQLNQRISIRHHLLPLTRKETEAYIYQRLMVAGAQGNITFSKSAHEEIFKFSKGIPRLINLLCDRTLLAGFIEEAFQIEKEHVKKAMGSLTGEEKDKVSSSYFPNWLTPLRATLLTVLCFVLILFMMTRYHDLTSFGNTIWAKVDEAYGQISANINPLNLTHPVHQEKVQKGQKNESEMTSSEGKK